MHQCILRYLLFLYFSVLNCVFLGSTFLTSAPCSRHCLIQLISRKCWSLQSLTHKYYKHSIAPWEYKNIHIKVYFWVMQLLLWNQKYIFFFNGKKTGSFWQSLISRERIHYISVILLVLHLLHGWLYSDYGYCDDWIFISMTVWEIMDIVMTESLFQWQFENELSEFSQQKINSQ